MANVECDLKTKTSNLHLICSYCKITTSEFSSLAQLREHYHTEHFACEICQIGGVLVFFDNADKLRKHVKVAHRSCTYHTFPRAFDTVQDLREHSEKRHHACPHCIETIVHESKEELIGHFDKDHIICPYCFDPTVFKEKAGLKAHLHNYHGFFDCKYCHSKRQPQYHWWPEEKYHMDGCLYPNARNGFKPCKKGLYCEKCERLNSAYRVFTACHIDNCEGEPHNYKPFRAHGPKKDRGPGRPDDQHRPDKHPKGPKIRQKYCHERDHFVPGKEECSGKEAKKPPPGEPAPPNIYKILKISPQATIADIKRACRDRRIESHPDKLKFGGVTKEEEERIDEEARVIGWACETILDPEQREKYDRKMKAWE